MNMQMKMTDKQKMVLAYILLPIVFFLSFFTAAFAVEGLADVAMAGTGNFLQKAFEQAAEMPSPRVEKALHSVNREYCVMDAKSQGRMQHRLAILGIKTPVRTGIYWPLVMYYHRVCAPTKADLRVYEQANYPVVKAIRHRYHAPVWNLHQAYQFCAKQEGVKATSPALPRQIGHVLKGCFTPKK